LGTTSAQDQVAQHGNVFHGTDLVPATGAGRAGNNQVVARFGRNGKLVRCGIQRGALLAPFLFHHPGQAMDDDIEKAAHQQA